MNKVIHVSDEIHAELKKRADRAGVSMSEFVGMLLSRYDQPAARAPPTSVVDAEQIVKRRVIPNPSPAPNIGDDPYSRPPFWAKAHQCGTVEVDGQAQEKAGTDESRFQTEPEEG